MNTYVSGFGYNTLTGRYEALLWTLDLCPFPAMTSQPVSRTVCSSGSAAFSVAASSATPATYQWQWQASGDPNWTSIVSGVNSFQGQPRFDAINPATSSVSIRPPVGAGGIRGWTSVGFHVRVVVSNTCGSTTSDTAAITVCPADFNCDGSADFFDYLDFVDAFSSQFPAADFNHDGIIDFFDYLDFVDAFSAGC